MVEEAVDGEGELLLNFLDVGSSSSRGDDSKSGCSPQAPSIKLKKYLASQPKKKKRKTLLFRYDEIKPNRKYEKRKQMPIYRTEPSPSEPKLQPRFCARMPWLHWQFGKVDMPVYRKIYIEYI